MIKFHTPGITRSLQLLGMLAVLVLLPAQARSELRLPRLISDNMVLQRQVELPIWGWAESGEQVTVSLEGSSATATAGEDGRWMARLDPLDAGGPFSLTVAGATDTITVENVLVGEVWLCAGQSNMALTLGDIGASSTVSAAGNYPMIRQFRAATNKAAQPLDDIAGSQNANWLSSWEVGGSSTAGHFSAAGYYFALDLYELLGVPVGLINNSFSGSQAEAWCSEQVFDNPVLAPVLTDWKIYTQEQSWVRGLYAEHLQLVAQAQQNGTEEPLFFCQPSVLYNAMTAPLIPYAIKGVTWYQGEGNIYRAEQYATMFPAMISDWRENWGQGDFPFLFVQLTGYRSYTGLWPALREAQKQGLNLPNTGMAVTIDIGDPVDIHPRNKKDVGLRLARLARTLVYGDSILYSGPAYSSTALRGDSCIVSFTWLGNGLTTSNLGPPAGFTLAGSDSVYYQATAEIRGGQVYVWSSQVPEPEALRYAWDDYPSDANLWNLEGSGLGLPASPFQWRRATGDLDGSGKLDIFDLLEMLTVLRDPTGRTDAADLDVSGRVDIFDLLTLLSLLKH